MRHACLNITLVVVFLFVSAPFSHSGWIHVGQSSIGLWQVYVEESSLNTNDKGYVPVLVLQDHPVNQMGIDRYDSRGEMYHDTRYPHRSDISKWVLDCNNRREVLLETWYYSGSMGTGKLVLEVKEKEPLVWSGVLFNMEHMLTSYVCDNKRQPR